MANTYRLETSKYQGRYMYLSLTQTKDIASNTSTINWTLTVTGGSSNYYSTGATTVKIDNKVVYNMRRVEWNEYAFPAAKGSVSGSLTVEHATDGNITIPVSIETAIYSTAAISASGFWMLDSIERRPTILTAPNFTDEENLTITYNNPMGAKATSLEAVILSPAATTVRIRKPIDKAGSAYTFVFTEDEKKALRQSVTKGTSKAVAVYVEAYIGTQNFISNTIQSTYSLVNALPTINPVAIDTNERAIELTGNPNTIIKGYNSVKVTVNATAYKEAVISSYLVSNGAKSITTAEGQLDYVETNTFTFRATDSRYNNAEATITLPMIEYIPVTCNINPSIEITSGELARITMNISGNYFSGNFGAQDNKLNIRYRYKASGEDYTGWIPVAADIEYIDGGYQLTEIIDNLNYKKKYTIQAIAIDKVYYGGKTSAEETVKAIPVFDWGENDFNFNVPVSIGGVEIDYIVEQGTKSGWTYRKWNSGRAECWKVLEFSTTINTAFGSLYCGNATSSQNYPFSFIEKPMEQVTLQSGNTQAFLYAEADGHGVNGAAASGRYNVFRPSAVTTSETFYLSFYVCGNWK